MDEFGFYPGVLQPEQIKELHALITREISHFTVSFVLNRGICGSGTLVRVPSKFGILTATHVVEQFTGTNKQPVGLIISEKTHQFVLSPGLVQRNDFLGALGVDQDTGPDISFLCLLSPHDESTICARKSVYLVDGKSFSKFAHFPLDQATWWVAGSPDQKSKSVVDQQVGDIILEATNFIAEGRFISITKFADHDLIRIAMMSGIDSFPENWQGVSGGGIWISRFSIDPTKGIETVSYESPFLAGVAFYQTAYEPRERTIIGHGPESIYQSVF